MGEYDEKKLCVTLERKVTIPGPDHEPSQTAVFRARERSVTDTTTWFFGLNIGVKHTAVEVSNDNIRSVVHLGPIDDSLEDGMSDTNE